ncbi:MAG: DNA polymerase III subunit delta', partial [Clostridia bacterium]|nr:DNA polymerase III subunit delta' [Clostridia bacterium]
MIFPLIGNERLKISVENLIHSGRFPHAVLLEGAAGSGRHTLAQFLTAAALCTETDSPCGTCHSCHLLSVGTHPDYICVAPEKGKRGISVDQIRELRQQAFVKAHIAAYRVFVIDGAERMNEQAQNALLKVLEEPPAGVILMLIATSRTALLDTIVSRCVVMSLGVPPTEQAVEYIAKQRSAERAAIEKALSQADGRIGRALELLDGKADDPAVEAAENFLELLQNGSEWELLKLLKPFEKDRAGTDALFAALKVETARRLRENLRIKTKARRLNRVDDRLC